MAAAGGRGAAHTMNSMLFPKPMMRKYYHCKSSSCSSPEPKRMEEATMMKKKRSAGAGTGESSSSSSSNNNNNSEVEEVEADMKKYYASSWVPDGRTGIYYPRGHENVMEDIPLAAAKDVGINWFS